MSKGSATDKLTQTEYFLDSFDTSKPGLKAYLGIVAKGQSEDYTVKTFAKGISTHQLLESWKAELKSISDEWPSLWQYENDLANKVGPMSIMLPLSERMSDIDSYYEGILLPQDQLSLQSLKAVVAEFSSVRGLRIRNQKSTVDAMKKSTNSGSPFFTKRRTVTKWTVPCSVNHFGEGVQQFLAVDEGSPRMAAAVIGWRGQEGGPSDEDVKQRVVWMFPYAVNIRELQVYQPLIEACQKKLLVPAWVSMDEVDRRITAMFDTKARNDLVVCTDFSKFDQHFNPSMQAASEYILNELLSPGEESSRWMSDVYPIKYMIPLAYDWCKVRFGKHGMGSGSGGTNADETLAHRALQYEAAQAAGVKLNPNSQCLGDDGVLTYPGITVDQVVGAYTQHGLEMNVDKQYASKEDCTYLRRWHHINYREGGICVGVYSTCRALGRMRYLERRPDPEVWSKEAFALRELSILENCKWHPLRDQFFDYCMKRDSLKLGKAIPGFVENIERVAQHTIAKIPDLMGFVKTQMSGDELGGITGWWSVNRLRSKA